MYGLQELKQHIQINADTVECPVKGCRSFVKRQKKTFHREPQFYCAEHSIYISPSTFEYADYTDNLLWKEADDLRLLEAIFKVKRESRMARNNSEDALSWNVFRYLEKTGQLDWYLSSISGKNIEDAQMMYWSYSQAEGGKYSVLEKASEVFGEKPHRGSEPDMIVLSKSTLFFIEAKFIATNMTHPSNPLSAQGYTRGAGAWYEQVFQAGYQEIAVERQKYELMRFWLLGSWMAKQLARDFELVNLVLEEREQNIEAEFTPLIKQNTSARFSRQSWEKNTDC